MTKIRGGHAAQTPQVANRKIQVRSTDHPRTDRWVALTTAALCPPIYRVGVVDGLGRWVEAPEDYPTLRKARNAANRLLTTELEND
jgi:hypothetical protein